MSALVVSLRCLTHPLTLLAIGVLLLNDHVLKWAVPSALTGKLSDVTGLFFFPFLLAALISLPLLPFPIAPRRIGAVAFCSSAVWFIAVKTLPAANTLTVAALVRLLGENIEIVPDPTDLLALPALGLAWRLWVRTERTPATRPGAGATAAVGFALAATLATSYVCPAGYLITKLHVEGNVIYAGVINDRMLQYDRSNAFPDEDGIFASRDGGATWQVIPFANIPAGARLGAASPVSDMKGSGQFCHPEQPHICYRGVRQERIERSTDGGATWQLLWRFPQERRDFMQRIFDQPSCKLPRFAVGPYDFAWTKQGDRFTFVAALGSQGVLIHPDGGEWKQVAVGSAVPIPPVAKDVEQARSLLWGETIVWSCWAVLVQVGCVVVGAELVRRRPADRQAKERVGTRTLHAGGVLVFSWLLLLVAPSILTEDAASLMILADAWLAVLGAYVLLGWLERRRTGAPHDAAAEASSVLGNMVMGASVFPLAWLPLVLWAFGLIAERQIAVTLAIAAAAAASVASLYHTYLSWLGD